MDTSDKMDTAQATKTADTGTKYPTHENEGNMTTSELGFTIKTRADHDKASTRVWYGRPGHHSLPSRPYKAPPRSKLPAERPMESGSAPVLQFHYLAAVLLKKSGERLHRKAVSVDATAASTGLPPTIVQSLNPAGGANTTASLRSQQTVRTNASHHQYHIRT